MEPEFRCCSYGFRRSRNAHQALPRLSEVITNENTQWIVEADIKGFFDNVNHDWPMKFLEYRIKDPIFLRIIRRFLKTGVPEDGVWRHDDTGTPQGGLISSVLANTYLHYVLDIWFERKFAKACQGNAKIVRYADDFVACFAREDDAKQFMTDLQDRLGQFGLEVEPSKTAILRFGSQAVTLCSKDGTKRPATFNFLGFIHYVSRSRKGRFIVGRTTQRDRITKKLKEVNQKLAQLSQRRSCNWAKFSKVLRAWMPSLRIQHNLYPKPLWMT
ncbi:reverse transcriptase domain-containing protein [Methylomonas sp. MgM2]